MNNSKNLVTQDENQIIQKSISEHDQSIFQLLTGKTQALQNEHPVHAEENENDKAMQAIARATDETFSTGEIISKVKNGSSVVTVNGKTSKKERKPWEKYQHRR